MLVLSLLNCFHKLIRLGKEISCFPPKTKQKSLSLTNCIVELAESVWPACSEATVGDSGVAAVEVVEPGGPIDLHWIIRGNLGGGIDWIG